MVKKKDIPTPPAAGYGRKTGHPTQGVGVWTSSFLGKDNMAPMVLNSMKIFVVLFLICFVLVGTVSAKAASSSVSSSVANPAISSVYATMGVSYCSDTSASTGTPVDVGELDVSSIPAVAAISLDGSPWTKKTYHDGIPLYSPLFTPQTGRLNSGTYSITIAKTGYKSYSGTVNICSQKVTYVHPTLIAIPTTTPTTPVTTTAATTATTTTTAAEPATTAAATTETTTAATTAATASASGTATAAVEPATTSSVAGTAVPPGSGSLSVATEPSGAAVYIDGVQRGVSPATIPGLAAGSHTVLLKLDGYQDLSMPVSITAGIMNEFSTGLTPLPAGGNIVPAITTAGAAATKTKSPGFGAVAVVCAMGMLLLIRKTIP
jgi:hypothetical protein